MQSYIGKTGAQIISNKLKNQYNVKSVFGYSGGAIMSLFDSFQKDKIKFYINTHEQHCGHAATGYAKSSNTTGICAVTSGPGLTNIITPLLDATNDSTPLIVFSGQVSLSVMGTGAFQECPAYELTKPVTKWSYCVKNVNEIPDVVDMAFDIANNKRKGSVHIDLPKCVLTSTLINTDQTNEFIELKKNVRNELNLSENNKIEKNELDLLIDKIIETIKGSNNPVFCIGQGCFYSDKIIQLLRELIKKSKIPITTTLHANGIFDEKDNLSLKFMGMHGSIAANTAIQEADCIIGIGYRFDDRTIGNIEKYAPKAHQAYIENRGGIINCNININDMNKTIQAHYNIVCDSYYFIDKLFYSELHNNFNKNNRLKWIKYLNEIKKHNGFIYDKLNNGGIKTQDVITSINDYINKNMLKNIIITTGVGNHQMMTSQYIDWNYPNKFITSGSLGVMGVGLPYAIGSQLANPNSIVIDIDGDSSFNQTLSDLQTVKTNNLPIKIAIINDGYQTMVRTWEQMFFQNDCIATKCDNNPKYHHLAESYGIKGIYCDDINDLNLKIKYFMEYDGPILCNFIVNGEQCLPLVPPGNALNNCISYYTKNNINENQFLKYNSPC
jgi:acetolactate synthase-1/2/3 large subunit